MGGDIIFITLGVIFFKTFAILGWIVNFIAIPYVSFFLLPLAFISVFIPVAQDITLHAVSIGIHYLLKLLKLFSDLPLLIGYHPSHEISCLLFSSLGLLILMMPQGLPGRFFSAGLLSPLLFQGFSSIPVASVQAHFLDVGHGLATVIQTARHTLIYDLGEPFITEHVLLPFLHKKGIRNIDKIIISHLDFDHVGSINSLVFYYPETILESSEVLHAQKTTQLCQKDQHWSWDGIKFSYVHPDQKKLEAMRNNRSCV